MKLLTVKDLARLLHITAKAVHNRLKRRGIKPKELTEHWTAEGLRYQVGHYNKKILEIIK